MIDEYLNKCSRVTLAKYSLISFTIFIILLTIPYILKHYLNLNLDINDTQNLITWLIFFATFFIYDGAFILLTALFMKSTFNKKRIYRINKIVFIPIINIIYLFQMEKHTSKINIILLAIIGYFFLPYIIYFYFKNRKECKNFNL